MPPQGAQTGDLSFAGFPALEEYLGGLGLFRMTPGLARISAVLGRLGLIRPPYAVIQVVGTNGKGSASSMLASLARVHGLRAGLHTSPHFLSVRERIRINGAPAQEELWLHLAKRLMRSGGKELSYFEAVTALAAMAFAETGVQLAVMETGLGGSFDATTALAADLVLLTPFALDHQAVLGPTLKDIARDKAGAIRPRAP
ncbi:MAG: bifunctional folylpolyglutamate synthase/dihydrofolate synthase, partial [Deltaproteobacteria bacterium]|nr:bifunctional folylpolyglutamate synthase/dihydrofolate synthase [Deltaproteobacteria bacterium]